MNTHSLLRIVLRSLTLAVAAVGSSLFATTYYIDSTSGSDSNSGTSPSLAWKTLARASNGPSNTGNSFSAGDSILLFAGETFSGQLAPTGLGTSTSPITIDMYGTGALPSLSNPTTSMAFGQSTIYLRNSRGFVVQNLDLTNPQGSGAVTVTIDHTGTWNYFRLRNLVCHDLGTSNTTATTTDRRNSAGIIFNNSLTSGGYFDDVQITNCTIWNGAGVGIQAFAKTVSGTVPTALRMTHSLIENCVVHDIANDGIIWRGADGSVIDHCTVFKTGTLQDHAMVGLWVKQSSGSVIQYCESYSNKSNPTDGEGYDFDIDVDYSTLQYSYSHDNEGGMLLICANDTTGNIDTGNTACYNVSNNDAQATTTWWGRVRSANLYNNTVYVASTVSIGRILKLAADYSGDSTQVNTFENNIIYCDPAATFDASSGTVAWTYNTFYGASLGTAPAGTGNAYQNPAFVSANSGGIGLGSVLGYKLTSTSPCRGAGVAITGGSIVDYLGWAVPSSAPDQGAFQYNDGTTESAPSTPSGLSAATRGTAQVALTWTTTGAPVEAVVIERAASGGSYSVIASAGGSDVTFIDPGVTSGVTYTYAVYAVNSAGASSLSGTVSVTAL